MPRDDGRRIDPRIWEAAVRLFAAKGFAATGIREIADAAGLSVSAMYYYVENKEDLLVQIMRDAQERLVGAGRRVAETFPEPATALAGLVVLHVIAHARSPLEARVVDSELRALGEDGRREMVALRDQYEAVWHDVLVRGVHEGVFSVRQLSATRLALLDICNGVSAWYSPGGALGIEQLAVEFADLALALVRAADGGVPIHVGDLGLPRAEWFLSAGAWAPVEDA
jgi:AcrR family transcriptional regulator